MLFICSIFIVLKKEKYNSFYFFYFLFNGDCILNLYCNLEVYDFKLFM